MDERQHDDAIRSELEGLYSGGVYAQVDRFKLALRRGASFELLTELAASCLEYDKNGCVVGLPYVGELLAAGFSAHQVRSILANLTLTHEKSVTHRVGFWKDPMVNEVFEGSDGRGALRKLLKGFAKMCPESTLQQYERIYEMLPKRTSEIVAEAAHWVRCVRSNEVLFALLKHASSQLLGKTVKQIDCAPRHNQELILTGAVLSWSELHVDNHERLVNERLISQLDQDRVELIVMGAEWTSQTRVRHSVDSPGMKYFSKAVKSHGLTMP